MWRFRSLCKHTTLLSLGVKRFSVPQCAVLRCYRSFSSQNNNLEIEIPISYMYANDFVFVAENNEVDKVRKMLQDTPRLVNASNENCATALMEASKRGYLSMARLLLENGADINFKDAEERTALMHASFEGQTELAQFLILKGANVNAKNKYGGTALSVASEKGHTSIVLSLLLVGADVNAKDKEGRTALIWASSKSHLPIVQLLLDHGADVNAKNLYGVTALMRACGKGAMQIVQFLLEKGADIHIKSADGETALMKASIKGRANIVQLLLDEGADIDAKAKDGKTALLYASNYGYTQVVQLLLDKGADVNAKNKDGKTALDFAKKDDIRRLLRETLKKQQTSAELIKLMQACFGDAENRPDFPSVIALLERHLIAYQRNEREHIPENFLCPITYDIMEDPVICSDGHSYERGAIEHWLQDHDTNPKTNMRLPNKNLIPNIALRGIIQDFVQRRARK